MASNKPQDNEKNKNKQGQNEELKKRLSTLTKNEIKVLKAIKESQKKSGEQPEKFKISTKKLAAITELQPVEVMRAAQWLENKGLITRSSTAKEYLAVDRYGAEAIKKGMPEKIVLKKLMENDGSMSIKEAEEKTGMIRPALFATIGVLKKKAAITMTKEEVNGKEETIIRITTPGEKLLNKESLEEKLLRRITEEELNPEELKDEWKFAYDNLRQRKEFIKRLTIKEEEIRITREGEEAIKEDLSEYENQIEKVTPAILKNKEWVKKKFRSYDVKSPLPKISHGKKHFVNEAIDYIKKIWVDLGFKELRGDHIQSAFWDLDALFVPQDHPAREMQDTFYLSTPEKSNLEKNALTKRLLKEVKEVHENGGTTGSKGWRYDFKKEEASKNLLRTHTTVLSAHKLAEIGEVLRNLRKKEKTKETTDKSIKGPDGEEIIPNKFFIVGKVYRNEALDWKHLFEFHQVDGIVIDKEANFKHLKGYLKTFFKKMGFKDVRLRPAHFPYTEPSVEVEVLHPVKNEWVELGGAGIFRPEVTKTLLGEEIPVLAWGIGLERIISDYYNITDIRELYRNDLEELKEKRVFLRGITE